MKTKQTQYEIRCKLKGDLEWFRVPTSCVLMGPVIGRKNQLAAMNPKAEFVVVKVVETIL